MLKNEVKLDGVRNARELEVPGAKNIHLPEIEFEDYITKLGDPELARHYLSQNMSREEMVEVAFRHCLLLQKSPPK